MLTYAPIPTWLNLFRALLRRSPSDAVLASAWHREGEVAGWLSRSAWSLALIALWRGSRVPTSTVTVWIPDYFCNASLTALRRTGAKLLFYPVTEAMEPDFSVCRVLADKAQPDIFVLVHYFGKPALTDVAAEFCKRYGAWLIEDAAHVLRPVNGVGNAGDFVLYSPHKHLPIPVGAVLVVRPNGPAKFGSSGVTSFGLPDSWPEGLRELQRQMGLTFNSGRVKAAVWLIKSVLQKLGLYRLGRATIPFAEPLESPQDDSSQLGSPYLDSLARRLLAGLRLHLEKVALQRQRHQLIWDELLANDEMHSDHIAPAARSVHREWTPYLAAYTVDQAAASTFEVLRSKGLPVTIWPDMPPEVIALKEHATAWHLRHSRFYLPVHQSLSIRALMKQCRQSGYKQASALPLRVVWDDASEEQWQTWLTQVGRSNLLQSWPYGETKGIEGWRVKRAVFYDNNDPIAFVQVLQKRVARILTVSRINRGPLFLRDLTLEEQRGVWANLTPLGNLQRGRLLTVAPELKLSGSSLIMMADMGFRQFSPRAWESVWLDIGLELDTLRERMHAAWRRNLTLSEKKGLQLEIGSDDQYFDWMMSRYEELMQEKDFSGPPIGFLRAMRTHLGDEERLLVLRAMYEGEAVAGICLARHGAAVTYLVGWNGTLGRNLKANQFLFWQAIKYLKQSGLRWFDLGGISEENNPGITAFKLGFNGERYELAGEYWKW
ncbi:MAG: GNAT family N-acetyltransferase [Methylobacter sp.]|nr:GNAT family N-acetyltransferase [Methylobacter sp.]